MNNGISYRSFLVLATTRTQLSSSWVLLTRFLPVSDQGSYTALQRIQSGSISVFVR